MNTSIESTTDNAEETLEQQKTRERFEAQELKFKAQEKQIQDMREWFERNRERIAPFDFCVCGSTVCFFSFHRVDGQQKDIAKAFGKDGWKREKDGYTCGALHWTKEFDGATLKIHEAEIVKFNPIEEVKL